MADDPKTTDFTGALSRIEALLARLGGKSDDGDEDDEPRAGGKVPYEKFFKVNQQKKAAEEAAKAAKNEVEALRAAAAAELKQVREASAAQVARLAAESEENLGLVAEHGFDRAGVRTVRDAYGRLSEDARKESLGDWWKKQVEAHKAHLADPEKAPAPSIERPLTVYLPQQAAPVQAESRAAAPTGGNGIQVGRGGPRNVDRGVVNGPKPSAIDKIAKAGTRAEFLAVLEDADRGA